MWEMISFMGGMFVFMLIIFAWTYLFELPEAIGKYLRNRGERAQSAYATMDSNEAAARLLGESLRRGGVSVETTAKTMAAFWEADPGNRRALAHLVAGFTNDGPVADAELLAMVRSLPSGSTAPVDVTPISPVDITAFREKP